MAKKEPIIRPDTALEDLDKLFRHDITSATIKAWLGKDQISPEQVRKCLSKLVSLPLHKVEVMRDSPAAPAILRIFSEVIIRSFDDIKHLNILLDRLIGRPSEVSEVNVTHREELEDIPEEVIISKLRAININR